MDRRTALAASISMMATVAVGTLAFAALGGIDVLGFGTKAQSQPLIIVENSPSSTSADDVATTLDTTTISLGELPPTSLNLVEVPPANGKATIGGAAPGATTPRAATPGTTSPATTPATDAPPAATPPAVASTAPPAVASTAPPAAVPTTATAPRTTPPATTAPPPATTAPPPASTLPPGVPSDWPPGKPIPPMPVGCIDGQLEDNGVWNCQH